MGDVFISYKSEEYEEAAIIRELFTQYGISCWMAPESIPGGSDYATEIPNGIDGCKVFVLMLSNMAQKSKWVKKEVDWAINNDKLILTFIKERFKYNKAFGFYLTDVQDYKCYLNGDCEYFNILNRILGELNLPKAESEFEVSENVGKIREARKKPEPIRDTMELYGLARRYYEGWDAPTDYVKALKYARKAAESGYPGSADAMNIISLCYYHGRGVSKDPEQCFHWCKKSADGGSAYGMRGVGLCYEEGFGVETDFEKAIKYLNDAYNSGLTSVQKDIDRIKSKM